MDDVGFGKDLEAIRPRVLQYARKLDHAGAEDLTQETLLRAWRFRATFKEGATLFSWVCQIARNAHIDNLRRLKQTDSLDVLTHSGMQIESDFDVFRVVSTVMAAASIRSGIAKMSPAMRIPATIVYLDGRSSLEAARETGHAPSSVRGCLFRVRKALRACGGTV